jgi:excisionase family DNA binding protein
MVDLLTAKQLQDLLRIDRTTIYRMLADGRLKGVKVGNQWRFPKEAVDALISGVRTEEVERPGPAHQTLPLNCIQPIQDVFADITQVSSLTTAPDGTPLTRLSSPCAFCSLILASDSGKQACIASWRKLATQPEVRPRFVTCHAGLHYARARIEIPYCDAGSIRGTAAGPHTGGNTRHRSRGIAAGGAEHSRRRCEEGSADRIVDGEDRRDL